MARTSKNAEQAELSEETRCEWCGPVEGRIVHREFEVETDADRLDLAERYAAEALHRDPESITPMEVCEILDHLANLRRAQMGLSTRAEIAGEYDGRIEE